MNYEPMVCAADRYTSRYSRLPSSALALSLFRRRLKDRCELPNYPETAEGRWNTQRIEVAKRECRDTQPLAHAEAIC
jgi:hypothetical protein